MCMYTRNMSRVYGFIFVCFSSYEHKLKELWFRYECVRGWGPSWGPGIIRKWNQRNVQKSTGLNPGGCTNSKQIVVYYNFEIFKSGRKFLDSHNPTFHLHSCTCGRYILVVSYMVYWAVCYHSWWSSMRPKYPEYITAEGLRWQMIVIIPGQNSKSY